MSKPQRILVTGGAGFIGSALVWALNQRGQENVLITDHLAADEKWKNLVALKYADYLDAADLLGNGVPATRHPTLARRSRSPLK